MSSTSQLSAKSESAKRKPTSEVAPKKTKSLREKVLTKAQAALKVFPTPQRRIQETTSTSSMVIVNTPDTLLEARLREAPSITSEDATGVPSEKQVSAEGSELTDDFDTSSVGSGSSATRRRVSLLYTSRKGMGVEMDAATRAANDLLQRGKEALETAGNMKREYKTTAHECLQGLYEIVLSVADSRSRHLTNLERERARHAQEIVRIERAHSKELMAVKQNLVLEMGLARADISGTLEEAKAVRSWLGYETEEPFKNIKAVKDGVAALGPMLREELSVLLRETRTTTARDPISETAEVSTLGGLNIKATSISNQLDDLRRTIEEIKSSIAAPSPAPVMQPLCMFPEASNEKPDETLKEILDLTRNINSEITTLRTTPAPPPPPAQTPDVDLTPHLQPLYERLEIVSSDLRTLRDSSTRPATPPQPNLGAELAMAEVKQTLASIATGVSELATSERPPQPAAATTYAQVAARPKPPTLPNHTLIISSKDPRSTSDNVIERVQIALDFKNTGARVDRCRKARNQKVVLSCASKEDLAMVKRRVDSTKDLQGTVPSSGNPLACIKNVLASHSDVDIIEMLKKQNKHLLHDVDMAGQTMKVRYRKRARNALECHPVVELSPVVWRKLTEAGKVHLGIRRSQIEDQSPLVQCTKCLGYGHTRSVCRENKDFCCYCSGTHTGRDCPVRANSGPPTCINCVRAKREKADLAHVAFRETCPERQRWDFIARSRISYC